MIDSRGTPCVCASMCVCVGLILWVHKNNPNEIRLRIGATLDNAILDNKVTNKVNKWITQPCVMRTWIIRPWILRPWMFFVAPVLLSGPQFSYQGLFIEGRGDDTHTRRTHVPYRITSHAHTIRYTHTLLYAYTREHIPLCSHTHHSIYTHTRVHITIIIHIHT